MRAVDAGFRPGMALVPGHTAPPQAATVQVLLLGSLDVVGHDGASVPLSGRKIRALMALLALQAGRVVSADRLIEGIYRDNPPRSAGNALQLQISKLRHLLAPVAGGVVLIVTRAPGYVLDLPPDDVDALRFGRLVAEARARMAAAPVEASFRFQQALALWRGPALADFSFDDFASSDRVRLEEVHLAALEDSLDVDLALGRHVECVERLEPLLAEHPLRERLWGQLMVALYRSGRQAESLRAIGRARHHLQEELGIEPGGELRRLELAILRQDPSVASPPVPRRPAATTADPSLTASAGGGRGAREGTDLSSGCRRSNRRTCHRQPAQRYRNDVNSRAPEASVGHAEPTRPVDRQLTGRTDMHDRKGRP